MDYRTVQLPEDLFEPFAIGPDVLVGLIGHRPSQRVAAFDLAGGCLWQIELDQPHAIGTVNNGECWLIGRSTISAYGLDAEKTHEFELPLQRRERIGALIRSDDSLFISIYRTKADKHADLSPRVIRLSLDGELVWSSVLPIESIAYEGCVSMGVATNWEVRESPPWKPSTWLPYGPDQLLSSEDRILASFQEMPRSGIGCRYVLNSTTGELMWKSRPAPISEAAALAGGGFLIGNQGYGAFETHQYEDGKPALTKWESHGYYARLSCGKVISLEMSNDLSVSQHLVEMLPGGTVQRLSDRLPGYYSSRLIITPSDTAYFWRADRIWSWTEDQGLREEASIGFGDSSFASCLPFSPTRFGIRVTGPHSENVTGRMRAFVVVDS